MGQGLDRCLTRRRIPASEDVLTVDIMDAYDHLGSVIGESTDDDLADRIFEEFCMGK